MINVCYKRILIKLSGESLLGNQKYGIDPDACHKIALSIYQAQKLGTKLAIVIGGGNIFRGANSNMQRVSADNIGMLATMINGISLQQALLDLGCPSKIMSAISCDTIVDKFNVNDANKYLNDGKVLIFVAGIGNPYFTTDSAATLRALEIKAEILLKATKVDGIFDKDPVRYSDAKPYKTLSYSEILAKNLQVMDATAIALARENKIPIRVFNIFKEGALMAAVKNDPIGTLVLGD